MMIKHRLAAVVLPAAIGLAGAGAFATTTISPASAATPRQVTVAGHCTGTSASNLQLQREDTGAVSFDFGVDMAVHKSGIAWKVKVTDNGVTEVNKVKYTLADGSWSVSRTIAPLPGTNTVSGTATNPASGEVCTATASI